jgi:hypothetical protein
MKNSVKIAATFAIIAFGMTSCQKELSENNIQPTTENKNVQQPDFSNDKALSVGTTVDLRNVIQFDSTQQNASVPIDKKALLEAAQSATTGSDKKLSPYHRRFRITAQLYCESKGGDDGRYLEPYGHLQVTPINAYGQVIAPPIAPGSSFLMNQPVNHFFSMLPGSYRTLKSVDYYLDTRNNTRLYFSGHLADDDVNGDDGFFPNANDNMGYRYNTIYLSQVLSAPGSYRIVQQRYNDGAQVVWATYYIQAL